MEISLKVAESSQEDVAKGRVRLDTKICANLGLDAGDIVEITGKEAKTAAIVWRAHPDDLDKSIIRMDGLIRDNARVSIGDYVTIRKIESIPAESVVLIPVMDPGQKLQFGSGIEGVVKRGLFKRPVTKNDTVIVPGIALIGRALPFMIGHVSPKDQSVIIDENTNVEIQEYYSDELVNDQNAWIREKGEPLVKELILQLQEVSAYYIEKAMKATTMSNSIHYYTCAISINDQISALELRKFKDVEYIEKLSSAIKRRKTWEEDTKNEKRGST